MKEDSPPIHARLWSWIAYSLFIVYATISLGTDLTISFAGLACVPVVLGSLLTARGLVLAVLHTPLDLFVGRHRVLSGVYAWIVPPVATLGLLGLNELGTVSYAYVSYSYKQNLDTEFQTDSTKPGESYVRMVRKDGTTYVTHDVVAKRDEGAGEARPFHVGGGGPEGITVKSEEGCHVTDGFRAEFPSLDQLGCAYTGQITVRASNPPILGVLWASAELDVSIEFDLLLWLPTGATTGVRGKSTVHSKGQLAGFSSKRAFMYGFGEQIGQAFGKSLLRSARNSLEKILN